MGLGACRVAVIDYEAGNIGSVQKALAFIHNEIVVTRRPDEIMNADGVVLPGVGAFKDCIENLRSTGLSDVVKKVIRKGVPFLGICLGYQMLFDYSEEHAEDGKTVRGLGIFSGAVKHIPRNMGLKVPHMGWNNLQIQKDSPLFAGLQEDPYVYFIHSYYVDAKDKSIVTAKSCYGIEIDVAIGKENVHGTQFHPEKSGDIGMAILTNFIKVVKNQ